MAEVIATAEIHRTVTGPNGKPMNQVIKPPTKFICEGKELAALRAARAVRDPEPDEPTAKANIADVRADVEEAPKKSTTKRGGGRRKAASKKDNDGDGDGNDLV